LLSSLPFYCTVIGRSSTPRLLCVFLFCHFLGLAFPNFFNSFSFWFSFGDRKFELMPLATCPRCPTPLFSQVLTMVVCLSFFFRFNCFIVAFFAPPDAIPRVPCFPKSDATIPFLPPFITLAIHFKGVSDFHLAGRPSHDSDDGVFSSSALEKSLFSSCLDFAMII